MTESQKHQDPKLLLSGIDSLYVSYWLDRPAIDWENLEYAKQCVQADRDKGCEEIRIGDRDFAVLPNGDYPYRYVLKDRDVGLRLTEIMQPSSYVQYSSEGLWLRGFETVTREIEEWAARVCQHRSVRNRVSRADIAFDFHLPVIDFNEDWFLSRATKDAKHRKHGTIQSVRFGAGNVVVRVYDKAAEIEEESGKYWFYDLWGLKENIWRVEFQIRGDALKKIGVFSLKNFRTLQWDLLREIALKHTSLRVPSKDTNRSRWPMHPLWTSLLKAIEEREQTGVIESFRPQNSLDYRLHRQLQSLYGALKGFGATLTEKYACESPLALEEVLEELTRYLDDIHQPIRWENDLEKRLKARRYGHE